MMNETHKENKIIVRQAKREDMKVVADMIQELADIEKMPDEPKLSVKDLERDGFERQPPLFRCKVAEAQSDVNQVVGYAIYYPKYSAWDGLGTMLEDLYVRPNQRGGGIGTKLFHAVAQEAWQNGSILDFHVLEWNPAMKSGIFSKSASSCNINYIKESTFVLWHISNWYLTLITSQ